MNKKGLSGWGTVGSIVILIVIIAILIFALKNSVANPLKKLSECPLPDERCQESCENAPLTEKTVENKAKTCKTEGKVCCMTAEEISGINKVKPLISSEATSSGGSGTQVSSGNTVGTTTSGNGVIAIRLATTNDEIGYDPTRAIISGESFSVQEGQTFKIKTWVAKGDKICSINLRNVTNEKVNRDLIKTTWFIGEIVRATDCDKAKEVSITPPTGSAGQKFKLDIMVFNSTTLPYEEAIRDSATLFINVVPQAIQVNKNTARLLINNRQVTSPLERGANSQTDEFNIVPAEGSKYCKVEMTDASGTSVPNNVCIYYPQAAVQDCTRFSNFKVYYDLTVPSQSTSCVGRLNSDGSYTPNILPEKLNVKVTFYTDANGQIKSEENSFTIITAITKKP